MLAVKVADYTRVNIAVFIIIGVVITQLLLQA